MSRDARNIGSSKGWIYFQVDNRGSPNRGGAFEDQIYHAMGDGRGRRTRRPAREWLKTQPFVDPEQDRDLRLVLRRLHDAQDAREGARASIAAGIAGAPVTKWELYDTHYTERYLGNPANDAKPYQRPTRSTMRSRSAIRCC